MTRLRIILFLAALLAIESHGATGGLCADRSGEAAGPQRVAHAE